MKINEYLKRTRQVENLGGYLHVKVRPRVVCVDGYTVSVQASSATYCTPRVNKGPYTKVELGFPSLADDLIMDYAEEGDDPTGTVYGYVPIELVDQLLDKHGGITIQ